MLTTHLIGWSMYVVPLLAIAIWLFRIRKAKPEVITGLLAFGGAMLVMLLVGAWFLAADALIRTTTW